MHVELVRTVTRDGLRLDGALASTQHAIEADAAPVATAAILLHGVASNFYTKDQQALVFEIWKGLFQPDWVPKLLKQLKDDQGGKPFGGGLSTALMV